MRTTNSSEMDDDDASSSLFHSCISSASATDLDTPSESNDFGGSGGASEGNDGEGGAVADSLPESADVMQSPSGDNFAIKPSSSSSNSSWSFLSLRERPKARSITFNRDGTCLLVCTSIGVRVRTLESLQTSICNVDVDSEQNNYTQSGLVHDVLLPPDGATYAQLLQNTSLLAVVKPSSPRCCYLYNAKSASSSLAALPLSAAVKRVELQRKVLAAMTVDLRLHVFHLTDSGAADTDALRPTLITTLNIMHPSDSPRNVTRGMDSFNAGSYFDLSPNEEQPYLICKSFNGSPGTVRVYDPTILKEPLNVASCNASIGSGSAPSIASSWDKYESPPATNKVKHRIHFLSSINAHDHSVTRMLIGGGRNTQQTYMATASSKGTAIRVFGLPHGSLLWEWHRGSRQCQIYSISWNGSADRLVTYGSSGTIHVFDWEGEKRPLGADEDDVDEGRDFERVHDCDTSRAFGNKMAATGDPSPLLQRIGSLIKLRTSGNSEASSTKHRSSTKLKYKPSASSSDAARSQNLVLSFLSSSDKDRMIDIVDREDVLVLCSMNLELRRYLVKKSVELTRIEDVLA
ncbi:hypothetical protein ACHAXA_005961 [Cyclostephanos tholiformis]|jgi:hypothetical protein|uniref:Uncharacterized protein n=1 Tax=Cyclostephanos tholiformis TaxID=382380 RepID=A0ABD3SEE5_9STRA